MSAHPMSRPFERRPHPVPSQRGAVLIVALILLAVLTLLGVTAMSTTSLEEKMAANTQEGTRAFQIAETGLATGFNNGAAFNLNGLNVAWQPVRLADNTQVGRIQYQSRFNGWSPPPQNSLYSAAQFHAAHFDFQSDGETWAGGAASGIASRHHGGAYQIAPKQ
jgi:Tfp pilus assembly protein PilV